MEHRIAHACGHEQVHDLPGFPGQQERKARWLRTTSCRACFVVGKRAEEAEAATRAGKVIATLVLADLTGSERQVTWATTIRTRRLAAVLAHRGAAAIANHPCLVIRDAKWWIDRRDLNDVALLASADSYCQAVPAAA